MHLLCFLIHVNSNATKIHVLTFITILYRATLATENISIYNIISVPLQKAPLPEDVVLRLPALVVVQSKALGVHARGRTRTQLYDTLVVGHLLVLGADSGEVDLVGDLTEVLEAERVR